jgi:N-acetylglucosaminyl-diphospho-decaprenol L-rhamnosyltransferase
MDTTPIDVSIVLVSWNTRELLLACLESLPQAVGSFRAEVWVVDNGSCDGSAAAVQRLHPTVHLIANPDNRGFAAANNQALHASSGRYVLLLNSDTIPQPGSIERLVQTADALPQAGVLGGMLLDPDGEFQASFADFPSLWSEWLSVSGLGARLLFRNYPSYGPRHSRVLRRVDYVPGACMLARREAIAQVGSLDEGYFMYSEESDWCWRMTRAGWQVWYEPAARIVHFGGQSTRQRRRAMVQALYRSKLRFFRRHYGPLVALLLQAMFVIVLRLKWLLDHGSRQRSSPALGWHDLQEPLFEG